MSWMYVKPLLMVAIVVAGAACSQTPAPPPYADAYRAALEQIQGSAMVTPAMTERFVRFFSHEPPSDDGAAAAGTATAVDPESMYGEPMYFSDTLLTTRSRAAAVAHLRRMREATTTLRVSVIDTQVSGQDVYLVWQMTAGFEPVRRNVTSNSVGVTHLRFDGEGRIVLHQDFWDSAEGFYRHLPIVGRMINTIRGTFEPDDD